MSRILWVTAHPDPHSLTAELARTGIAHLRSAGHEVLESNLYEMQWDPVVTDSDFTAADRHATLSLRQRGATHSGTLAPDIQGEQDKLLRADGIVIQFPLWWYGMPAILKGWFDRVFTNGFAFSTARHGSARSPRYGDGTFRGRPALAVVTAGDRASALGPRGVSGPIEEVLWPLLHGVFHYTGMSALPPHLIASADRIDATALTTEKSCLISRLDDLWTDPPISYRSLDSSDYSRDHSLAEQLRPGERGIDIHRRRPPHQEAG